VSFSVLLWSVITNLPADLWPPFMWVARGFGGTASHTANLWCELTCFATLLAQLSYELRFLKSWMGYYQNLYLSSRMK
jgi:hypothetical protein